MLALNCLPDEEQDRTDTAESSQGTIRPIERQPEIFRLSQCYKLFYPEEFERLCF